MNKDEQVYYTQYGIPLPKRNNDIRFNALRKLWFKKKIYRGQYLKGDQCGHVIDYIDNLYRTIKRDINNG